MTSTDQPSSAPSLSADDILADLSALSSPASQPHTSTSSLTASTTRHPILSLGHSLAPAETLSSSERSGSSSTEDVDALAAELLNGAHAADGQSAAQQLRLLEQYLTSAKQMSSLNHGTQDGESTTDPGVDILHERIAQLQVKLDALERGVQDALNAVDQHAS